MSVAKQICRTRLVHTGSVMRCVCTGLRVGFDGFETVAPSGLNADAMHDGSSVKRALALAVHHRTGESIDPVVPSPEDLVLRVFHLLLRRFPCLLLLRQVRTLKTSPQTRASATLGSRWICHVLRRVRFNGRCVVVPDWTMRRVPIQVNFCSVAVCDATHTRSRQRQ